MIGECNMASPLPGLGTKRMTNLTFDTKLTLIDYFKFDTIKII